MAKDEFKNLGFADQEPTRPSKIDGEKPQEGKRDELRW